MNAFKYTSRSMKWGAALIAAGCLLAVGAQASGTSAEVEENKGTGGTMGSGGGSTADATATGGKSSSGGSTGIVDSSDPGEPQGSGGQGSGESNPATGGSKS